MDTLKEAYEFVTPEKPVELITELAKGIRANKILDPACGSANLLVSVAMDRKNVEITGIEINQNVSAKAEMALQKSGLKYQLVNADFFFTELQKEFDLIVFNPPFGTRVEKEIDGVKVRNIESAFILQSLQLLNPDGYAIFIIPEGVLFNESGKFIREYLLENYSLQAVISLPSNTFQPYSAIKTSVLVVKNSEQTEKIFFAEFAESQALEPIASNFKKQASNKNLSQGFWVDIASIKKAGMNLAYGRLKSVKEFETKKANAKYPLRLLSELVSIGRSKSSSTDAVLIQRIGNQPKAIMKDELPEIGKQKNYIELHISNEEILPLYLKLFLNSEQGKNQLQSVIGGSVIPSIRAQDLENIYVEVPDMATQIQIASTAQKLAEVSATIQVTTNNFQSQLFNYSELLPLVERFRNADEENISFDNLISPLASSFRIATIGSPNINSQLDSYFKMFEIIAVLNSIVLLSALPEGIRRQYEKEIWTDKKSQYSRVSFGLWLALYRRLANLYRHLKDEDGKKKEEDRILCTLPFDEDFYLDLSNQELLTILDAIPEKRNRLGGAAHGGIIPEIVAQKTVNELHPSLMKVFEKLTRVYSALELIYPESMKKSNGLYKIKIKKLQGTHYPYAEQEIQTELDLNTDSLYLNNFVSNSRLELLSEFVKLIQCESCGHWSIYFYSKTDGKKAHYVSYQNEIHEYACSPSGFLLSLGHL